jgi:hypothetical protein
MQEHPEKFICGGESGTGVLALEHRQLLTRRDFRSANLGGSETTAERHPTTDAEDRTWGWNS